MTEVDYHPVVGEPLTTLVDGLSPFVDEVLTGMLPPGAAWPDLLRAKDIAAGRRGGEYRSRDLALLLRAMTERLGDLGFPFSSQLPRQAQPYASELREVRNRWAHTETFTADQARRAVETAELLLRDIGATDHADRVAELKPAITTGRHAKPEPTEPLAAATEAETMPRIAIHAVADLSYPMAHCRIPVIDHIAIDNTGDELRGAVLEVDVTSAAGSHGGPEANPPGPGRARPDHPARRRPVAGSSIDAHRRRTTPGKSQGGAARRQRRNARPGRQGRDDPGR